MLLLRALVVWLVIIGVETIHGILRTLLLAPLVGDFRSRQIGVFVGSLLILGVVYGFHRWIRANTHRQRFAVGLLWVILTVLFETMLGRFVMNLPWERLFEDYDLPHGGFMGFGLIVLAASPWLAACAANQTSSTQGRSNGP